MKAIVAIDNRAAELRTAFDLSFAEAVRADDTERLDFLAVAIGVHRYAIRLSEIAGLFADRKITPVPSRLGTLLGVAGFRGAIVPVHDLRALLGHSSPRAPRWLVLAAAMPVALAFDLFESHVRLSPDEVVPGARERGSTNYVRHVARMHDRSRPIVDFTAVLRAIKASAGG
jgi:chemotaxis signal transduction protein